MIKISETYGPFSSGAGDTDFTDTGWQNLLNAAVYDGVLNVQNKCAITAGTGMTVNQDTGQIVGHGLWYENDASKALTITTADATHNRIDTAVVHFDLSAKTAVSQVNAGTPAASPTPPSLTQSSSVWEVPLADILVPAGASDSSSFTITNRGRLIDEGANVVYGISNGILMPLVWYVNGDATHAAKVYLGGGFGSSGGAVEYHAQMDHKGSLAEWLQTVPGEGSSKGLLELGGQPSSDLLTKLGNMSVFSGTGPVTGQAHGLGKTPDLVLVMPVGGTPFDISVANLGATTCDIHMASGIAQWVAIAIKNG